MASKSKISLVLSCLLCGISAAVLLTAGLAFLQPPEGALARGTAQLCVHDGDLIQDAIDLADPGDTIAIESGIFTETLQINKSLTLSGGWETNCATRPITGTSVINANYAGRGITVQSAPAGTVVELEYLIIMNGDATGLGGADAKDPPSISGLDEWIESVQISDTESLAPTQSLDWKGELEAAAQQGLLPGDEDDFKALMARVEGLMNQEDWPKQANLEDLSSPAQMAPTGIQVDCGGGIYVDGAALELKVVTMFDNVASRSGPGYGGGLCAVNLPEAGLKASGNVYVNKNTASQTENGIGGGFFIDGADQAAVTFELMDELGPIFWKNTASVNKSGIGGGMAIYNSPQVSISDTSFDWNLSGSYNNTTIEEGTSYAGGLYLEDCPQAEISKILVINNMADSGGMMGIGGGMAVVNSEGIQIDEGTYFGRNTAHTQLGLYGPTGLGGGLALLNSNNATIDDSKFVYNLASLYSQGYGGGFYSFGSSGLTLDGNYFWDNSAAYYPNGNLYGGGVALIENSKLTIQHNEFKRNSVGLLNNADFFGLGPAGGGLALDGSHQALIEENLFLENTGMVSGVGHGAGILVGGESSHIEITNNTFMKNVSARNRTEGGPAAIGEGAGVLVDVASSVNIHHNMFDKNSGTTAEYVGSVIMVSGVGNGSLGSTAITVDANRILNSGYELVPETVVETGGIRVVYTEYITLTNNLIANSSGYGVLLEYVDSRENDQYAHAQIVNNTLVEMKDYGLGFTENWSQDILTVTNNIVVSSTVGMTSDSYNNVQVDHNLFYGNSSNLDGSLTESGSIFADPLFVDAAGQDYQLQMHSPARDAGAGIPPAPTWDINSVSRPVGSGVDIGAFEYPYWLNYLNWILK